MIYNLPDTINTAQIFQVTLDGSPYTLKAYYQPFGQRYYIQIYDQTNVMVVNIALIDNMNMLQGYFKTSTLVYSQANQQITILP